ncbi:MULTISPECIES: TIGR00730 family Rossman fold protein [unclassified Microbacterium]|uniref:LOG family protein n=2 Tax=Microbacterium TaxID=33882 RepID=UPI001D673248|nr:TIGR00730 family Rossman fold protein [Microbacterium sp.]CAH0139353.1 Cytokinin riboside 5'-monophosphate phosphoribohydrolase [Microbacterium sp. Bi121]HWK77386.1 TIGR00730 family Rossman fold protein [Microbacterium sp.]
MTDGQHDALNEAIERIMAETDVAANRSLIRRIVRTGIQLGEDGTERLNLKIASAALAEMRDAFRLFQPYADVPKVTVFGSARTRQDDPLYSQARSVAEALAQRGWMVVTGAGPGIMQAAAEGAGERMALGVSIRLPFEEKPSAVIADETHSVEMKYFFTRKLMLVKESTGFICLPGGFGTLDEMFELLTLQQTGKAEPMPIVLLDEPGGTFWRGLERFIIDTLIPAGVISPDDFERVLVTDSAEDAVTEITGFWHNYDSLRWVDDLLVLRLKNQPTDAEIERLNEEFSSIVAEGRIERSGALPVERADNDRIELPRLALHLGQREVGGLYRLIDAINLLGSARG